jgi:hypothetical protein
VLIPQGRKEFRHWVTGAEPDVVEGLSEPVRQTVDRAVPLVEELLADLLSARPAAE